LTDLLLQTLLHDLEEAFQALQPPQPLSPPVLELANPLDVVYPSDLEALLLVLEDPHPLLVASLDSPQVVSQERRHRDSLAVEHPREDLVSYPGANMLGSMQIIDFYIAGFAPPPGFAPQGGPRK
jgi:hypothetical protein